MTIGSNMQVQEKMLCSPCSAAHWAGPSLGEFSKSTWQNQNISRCGIEICSKSPGQQALYGRLEPVQLVASLPGQQPGRLRSASASPAGLQPCDGIVL